MYNNITLYYTYYAYHNIFPFLFVRAIGVFENYMVDRRPIRCTCQWVVVW